MFGWFLLQYSGTLWKVLLLNRTVTTNFVLEEYDWDEDYILKEKHWWVKDEKE